MTSEQIEQFIRNTLQNKVSPVKISFKTRNPVEGFFIQGMDYSELRGKNFWRVVTVKNMDDYSGTKDVNLSRIFNGSEFTKLAPKS